MSHAMTTGVPVRNVARAYKTAKRSRSLDRHARNRLRRAAPSLPLNSAEGNGTGADADRRRFFASARSSASACGSIRDCPEACKVPTAAENLQGRTLLIRIVSMPTKLGRRSHEVRENRRVYENLDNESYSDNSAKPPR
jgi:four helix bundle protein